MKSKRKANGKGCSVSSRPCSVPRLIRAICSQRCCSQHSRRLSSSFSASSCAFDVMRVMHQWGKCGQICSISSAVLDTFTRDNTHQRAILSINHGGTLSLNLRHGKGPRELPVLLQNRRLQTRRTMLKIAQQTNRLANALTD